MQTFVIHEDIQNTIGALETSGIMIKGFRTAVKLIEVISSEQKKNLLKFYPTYIVRSIVIAALWLLKLVAFSHTLKSTRKLAGTNEPYHANTPNALLDAKSVKTAENYVREAFTVLLKFSTTERDESQRAARFIEFIGGSRADEKPGSVGWGHSVKVRSRMGSGLYYDALWEVKERMRFSSAKSTPQEDVDTPDRDKQKGVYESA